MDLTQQPGVDDGLLSINKVRRALALRPHLNDPLVLARSGHHRLALNHVHTDGFLDIYVCTLLDRFNHWQGMPVIRRTDEHDVQFLFVEHLAPIAVGSRLFARFLPLAHQIGSCRQHVLIWIAKGDSINIGNLYQPKQIAFPVPSRSD